MAKNEQISADFKRGYFWGIRRRLLLIMLLMFTIPYTFMLVLTISSNIKMQAVKENALNTYETTNKSFDEAQTTITKVFKFTAIDKAESLSEMIELIISLYKLDEAGISSSQRLVELLRVENIGQESQLVIVKNNNGEILQHKFLDVGLNIESHMPLLARLIREKNYAGVLKSIGENPSLAGNIGTVSGVFKDISKESKSDEYDSRFVIITPIANTDYSLGAVILMSDLSIQVIDNMESSLELINTTLLEIDEQCQAASRNTIITLLVGAVFGIILLILSITIIKKRIIDQVEELQETAISISDGHYNRRVRTSLMTENFKDLGEAINQSLDTITELIETEEDQKRLQENIISLLDIVSRASKGDLSKRSHVGGTVLGAIVDSFNMMLDSISKLIIEVKISGRQVTMAATSILDTSKKISVDAKRQGEEIDQITGIMQQASRKMQRVSITADMANEESQRATIAAREGARKVNETVQSMQLMRNNVQATAKTIKMLGDRSLEINAIVEMINDISARTNILSLNAAIEASKAGEQGKGFAVVADEIRKLADRTTNATKEISSFIEDIQIETNDAVLSMEEVTREVEHGSTKSDQAGMSLRQIREVVTQAAEKIMEISQVASDMVSQMDSVVEDIKSVHQVTRETTQGIHRSEKETRGLFKHLNRLNKSLRLFMLSPRFEQKENEWIFPELIENSEKDELEDIKSGHPKSDIIDLD